MIENLTVRDKTTIQLRVEGTPVRMNSGVLIMIINDCIPYINELNQHEKHIVIRVLLNSNI